MEQTFKVEVNPFLRTAKIESVFSNVTYTQELSYTDLDEWNSFEMAWECFDIHFLYDDKFKVSIYPIEDEVADYTRHCIVHLKIIS
jgi:hypothetical protein